MQNLNRNITVRDFYQKLRVIEKELHTQAREFYYHNIDTDERMG